MAFNNEEYTRTFTSFSGADIACTFNGRIIGELQAIQYHVQREVAPVYTMSSPDARSFSRGKRGISGSLIFVQFDRDALLEEMKKGYTGAPKYQMYQTFKANAGDLESKILNGLKATQGGYGVTTWDEQMTQLGYLQSGGDNQDFNGDNLTGLYEAEYADQLMPFNITLNAANEFGQRASMEIYGVQILNEGSGFSIDDVITAKAYQFVARKIKPIKRRDPLTMTGGASASTAFGEGILG